MTPELELVQSLKCQAMLTTGDSFEKVTTYYDHKFASGPQEVDGAVKGSQWQSVSIQDDSSNRPVQLRVIVVNRANTSTTLVISRTKDETRTHIAWVPLRAVVTAEFVGSGVSAWTRPSNQVPPRTA